MLKIERIAQSDWEIDIAQYHGGVYMAPLWIDALVKNGSDGIFLNFVDAHNQVVAKLAGIVITGNAIKGKQLYFYSAPALISVDNALFQQTLVSLKMWAVDNGFARISIRPWDQVHSFKAQVSGFRATTTYEYEVDLAAEFTEKTISSRILRNIKKARKAGLQIRKSTSTNDLRLLLSFLESTKNRRNTKFGGDYSPFYINQLSEQTIAELIAKWNGRIVLCPSERPNAIYHVDAQQWPANIQFVKGIGGRGLCERRFIVSRFRGYPNLP
jgi:hypothetical protein